MACHPQLTQNTRITFGSHSFDSVGIALPLERFTLACLRNTAATVVLKSPSDSARSVIRLRPRSAHDVKLANGANSTHCAGANWLLCVGESKIDRIVSRPR